MEIVEEIKGKGAKKGQFKGIVIGVPRGAWRAAHALAGTSW